MITTRKELSFYLKADRMMNRGTWTPTITDFMKGLFIPDSIMLFLSAMRHTDFYSHSKGCLNRLLYLRWSWRFQRLSLKLGFSMGSSVFGYGLVIYHYGTIVVGRSNRVGNYAVLLPSTCIADKSSVIGNGLYLSAGAVISKYVELGDNITIGANSVVCKSMRQSNILLVGAPATIKKDSPAWYLREGSPFEDRVLKVESLKVSLGL